MTDMLCSKCDKHYLGRGWFCWSGNKISVPHCNNGNPDKNRIVYNSRDRGAAKERELIERGVINDRKRTAD